MDSDSDNDSIDQLEEFRRANVKPGMFVRLVCCCVIKVVSFLTSTIFVVDGKTQTTKYWKIKSRTVSFNFNCI